MSKLSDIMATPLGEIKPDLLPPGGYYAKLLGGSLREPSVDSKGREYVRATLRYRIIGPDEYTSAEVSADSDTTVYQDFFIYGKNDLVKFRRTLERLGMTVDGQSLEEAVKALDPRDVKVVLGHREYQGETRVEVVSVQPA